MSELEKYIDRTFELAIKGKGFVSPNPMVGAVIVRDGQIISEGWHKEFGGPHAEVDALSRCKDARGATLYVNLAPCCHVGKTGACTDAIVSAGIKKVVYSNSDPNPLVADKSKQILEDNGIEVTSGILENRGFELNRKYFHWIKTNQPYITIKAALTLDGKIATSSYQSKWITGPSSRGFVHQLRKGYDAILVGANTVLYDDPNLGLHGIEGREPLRMILTSDELKFSHLKDLSVFRDKNYVFINSISDFVEYCESNNISSVFVEGGSKVITSFIKSKMVNDMYLFYGPKILGSEHISAVSELGLPRLDDAYNFNIESVVNFGDSFMVKLSSK